VSPLVLAEVDQLAAARFGSQARTSLIDFIPFQTRRDRFLLPHVTIDLLETGRSVQPKYAALNLDLADTVNVAVAAEYPCSPWIAAISARSAR
jgi:predicted nucleic acid-binding protein